VRRYIEPMRIKGLILTAALICAALVSAGVAEAGLGPSASPRAAAATGSLYQQLVVDWSHDDYAGNDRASFQIPGIGTGDVVCSPGTTWIQMVPSDPTSENDFWTVLSQTKAAGFETAVRDARVYRYSTPTSTIPHGTGTRADIGFNQSTPVESASSGSLVGLISKRNALNVEAGPGAAPTSVHLSWSWSGFGTAQAACHISATFMTAIGGASRRVAEGDKLGLPAASDIGPVASFGVNWHGEDNYTASLIWPSSLTVPGDGTLSGVCEVGPGGLDELTLTPAAGTDPYAEITTYQGEGIDNAQTDDYYTDPASGTLGPIPLPVNGFIQGTLLPAWNASGTQQTQLLVSSVRKLNDPTAADNYCEVAVQAVSSPNPLLSGS
jgi:hypothetical protein